MIWQQLIKIANIIKKNILYRHFIYIFLTTQNSLFEYHSIYLLKIQHIVQYHLIFRYFQCFVTFFSSNGEG